MAGELGPKGIGFLALSINPAVANVQSAVQRMGIHLPVAVAETEMLGPYGLKVVPSTLFVDAQGRVVEAAEGSHGRAFFAEHAQALLGP